MIEYDRIDFDESIDINKTSSSRECWLCHFWYFLDKNFNYQTVNIKKNSKHENSKY